MSDQLQNVHSDLWPLLQYSLAQRSQRTGAVPEGRLKLWSEGVLDVSAGGAGSSRGLGARGLMGCVVLPVETVPTVPPPSHAHWGRKLVRRYAHCIRREAPP